ncbi:hypothetical protein EDB84DRAFT_756108 [Lactarius hengduanensis]|nr:hypothetical protein EDB84DRAFT_756108 [Lactarius hengduanensis]
MSTMLTRASARARLAKRVTIGKLPEDVLLEIFDAYRQDMEPEPFYENIWNGRNHGWFKLAHVCQRWRRVVFSSPSLLHVHLLFTPHRSPRMALLKLLPLFPILIDHRVSSESWRVKTDNLALAAIKYRSRVRGITLRRPYTDIEKFLTALSYPFPELESLEICTPNDRDRALDLPATFLCSAPCLRRLTLREVAPRCLSPLSSSATGLVELALTLRVSDPTHPEASLLTNLQRMSCLLRLELKVVQWLYRDLDTGTPPPASTGDVVPLSKLTHLIFSGNVLYLVELVVGLAAPSLRHLDVDLYGWLDGPFPILRLCRFIRETECQFTAIRLGFSCQKLAFHAGMGSRPVDDQPFKMIFPENYPLPQMGQELSGLLSTVEELIVAGEWYTGRIRMDQWRGFCYHVPQVKTVQVQVQVSARLALDVAHSFQQDGEPIPNFFPALERVEVLSVAGRDDIICDAFEPLITARQREGRPVRLSWILVEE